MSDDPEADLLAVFDKYNLPEPRHGEHPMKCPVHDDRVASASVNRGKGLWHCHACGAGGNAVSLVAALESVDYQEANRIVRGLVGGSTGQYGAMQGVRRKRSSGRWVPPSLRRAM
jgi:DNA primase